METLHRSLLPVHDSNTSKQEQSHSHGSRHSKPLRLRQKMNEVIDCVLHLGHCWFPAISGTVDSEPQHSKHVAATESHVELVATAFEAIRWAITNDVVVLPAVNVVDICRAVSRNACTEDPTGTGNHTCPPDTFHVVSPRLNFLQPPVQATCCQVRRRWSHQRLVRALREEMVSKPLRQCWSEAQSRHDPVQQLFLAASRVMYSFFKDVAMNLLLGRFCHTCNETVQPSGVRRVNVGDTTGKRGAVHPSPTWQTPAKQQTDPSIEQSAHDRDSHYLSTTCLRTLWLDSSRLLVRKRTPIGLSMMENSR